MYPYLHDFFNDVFGWQLRLPFPMFGFWVAMAFLAAHYIFTLELKRKENQGLLQAQTRKKVIGEKVKPMDFIINALTGFIIGYKGLEAFFNYEEFTNNPPDFIFSIDGSFFGGLLGASIMYYFKYREGKKQELEKPRTIEMEVHPYQLVGNMTMVAAVAGILGAKLFHNLENLEELVNDPVGALLSFSGLSIFGGLIIGGLAVVYYAVKNGIRRGGNFARRLIRFAAVQRQIRLPF
jgi:prolipoprotein diacylglyceryltransferase